MVKLISQKYIRIPREDYMQLKRLKKHFGIFLRYFERVRGIQQARQEVRAKKTIAQECLFEELGL